MARPLAGLLILLLATQVAAQTASTTDVAGDAAARVGGEPVHEPSVDLLRVSGVQDNGTLRLTIQVASDIPTASGDPDRRHTHLFMVAYGAPAGESIFQQVSEGRDALAVVCDLHEGVGDLGCQMSVGDASIRGVSAVGANLTVRIGTPYTGDFEVAASTTLSVPDSETDTERSIVAQDFTENALPYTGPPSTDSTQPPTAPGTPWYKTPWLFALLALGAVGGYAVYTLRK